MADFGVTVYNITDPNGGDSLTENVNAYYDVSIHMEADSCITS
jgi:hypothetical protein